MHYDKNILPVIICMRGGGQKSFTFGQGRGVTQVSPLFDCATDAFTSDRSIIRIKLGAGP